MDERKIRKYMLVDGIVQGVGFRWYVRHQAECCHLTGWVKNRYDGKVEMEVQGYPVDIDRYTGLMLRGNGYARVMSYEEEKREPMPELDFRVKGY